MRAPAAVSEPAAGRVGTSDLQRRSSLDEHPESAPAQDSVTTAQSYSVTTAQSYTQYSVTTAQSYTQDSVTTAQSYTHLTTSSHIQNKQIAAAFYFPVSICGKGPVIKGKMLYKCCLSMSAARHLTRGKANRNALNMCKTMHM